MSKVIFKRKIKNILFQICVKKVSFLLILFALVIVCTYGIASNTYTGKYLVTEGVASMDSHNNLEIQIAVEAALVSDIVKENNIKWYVGADNLRHKAVIKEIYYEREDTCKLVLQLGEKDKYKIGTIKKVHVIVMYGRHYML